MKELAMPSNTQRIFGVVTTGVILVAGGWLAAQASYVAPAQAKTENETAESAPAAEAPAPVAQGAMGQSMNLTLTGLRSTKGTVHIMLFDDESAYNALDENAVAAFQSMPATPGAVSVTFDNLSDRAYAVVVHHDENDNGVFDTAGEYPLEGYGTSRATSAWDELDFASANVRPGEHSIQVFYWE
jgi:uncharacterized protein (DUF2141 family)